jgi:hypothetical protein
MNDVAAGSGSQGRVVVGVDGAPDSLAALRRAVYQARLARASCPVDICADQRAHAGQPAQAAAARGSRRARSDAR